VQKAPKALDRRDTQSITNILYRYNAVLPSRNQSALTQGDIR
jgi:hypothetical protein